MSKLFIHYILIFFCLFACNEPRKETASIETDISARDSLIKQTDLSDGDSDHKIDYSDSLLFNKPDWSIEWTREEINNTDSVFTYVVDPVYHQTIRVLKKGQEKILLREGSEIPIPQNIGHLAEVIGHLLIFNKYVGNEYEGIITKYIGKINNQSIRIYDSIPAGEYGEGYGATERIVSENGEPLGGIMYPDDIHYWDYENLVLMKLDHRSKDQHALLINNNSKDTVVNFSIDLPYIRSLGYYEDNLIFYNNGLDRLNYLNLFNSMGKLEWRVTVSTLSDILVSPNNKMIVATGYNFIAKHDKNTTDYFTVAYDIRNGNRIWDFPTALAYNENYKTGDGIVTPNLFQINEDTFGIIVGKWANYGPEGRSLSSNNKLIIFDNSGRINHIIKLSDTPDRYTFSKINNSQFDLVGYQNQWSFKIKSPKVN